MTSKPVVNTPVGSYEGVSQNITTNAQSIVFPAGEDGAALIQLSGDAAGHNVAFEGTVNGTNWFFITGYRTDTRAESTSTGTLAGNPTYAFRLNLAGLAAFRLRSTAHSSGTATWTASYSEEDCAPAALAPALATSGSSSGGSSLSRISAAVTSGVAKASGGRLYGGTLTNHSAGTRYVHLYNKATAATLSTDTPVATIGLQAGQTVDFGDSIGMGFATGIAFAATTDNIAIPATAATAGDISGTLRYS